MDRSPQTWHLHRQAPVRADAEGLFIASADLPAACVGDLVVVEGAAGGDERTGTIAATTDLDGRPFFRLELLA